MDDDQGPSDADPRSVSAPYERFRDALKDLCGYNVAEEADRMSLAFEPWFVESCNVSGGPCLRITFRRVDGRAVLESFVVDEEGETRDVDTDAAHDALQAWVDYVTA